MPNVVSIDGLSPQERAFVEWFGRGLTKTQAAARAGYANPNSSGGDLLRRAEIQAAVEAQRQQFVEVAQVTKKDVVEGIKEGIDMARQMSDPQTMIVGWRELAKICGYYETKSKVEVNVTGQVRISQLEQMSDQDLLKIIEGEAVDVSETDR